MAAFSYPPQTNRALVRAAQPRPAWRLEDNLGIVQREKLVNVVPPIEEFDPSARDCDVLLRHVPGHYLLGNKPLQGPGRWGRALLPARRC